MPPISVMIKPASGSCNMQCTYCFYCDEQEKRSRRSYGMMSEATLKNSIRKTVLHAEGSCFFAFQGGEPSLAGLDFFKKAVEYAEHYNRRGIAIHFAFQTNGTNLTEEWCEFFREHHFLVGVSVDGTREIHDKYRKFRTGEPTYEKIMDACRMLEKYQVEYNILTVVNREIAENPRTVYQEYQRKNWMYQQYIACLDPLFTEKGGESYSLTPDAYGRFLTELFDCWYKDYKEGKHPYNRQFENYIGLLRGYLPESCEQRGSCGIQYVIEADGSVFPCDFYMLDDYCLGNINENSFGQMDEKRREIGFAETSLQIAEECRECPYFKICRNGCQRCRVQQPDGLWKNYFCEAYKFFFENCLERMQEIADTVSC